MLALLPTPLTTTLTPPLPASDGTVALIRVSDQLTAWSTTPAKATVLEPWLAPKPVPFTWTCVPAGPRVGESTVMRGLRSENCVSPLLLILLTTTDTGPV